MLSLSLIEALVKMELDTGASVSLISLDNFNKLWPNRQLAESNTVLHTYTGETIKPKGAIEVQVKYNEQSVKLPLLVAEGKDRCYLEETGLATLGWI